MEKKFKGRVVVPGTATLKALVSHGGFNTLASFKDMKDGKCICTDQNNKDIYQKNMVGVALCLPQTIGSTTGGMVFYCAVNNRANPAALLFSKPIDSLAAAGSILAHVWIEDNQMPTVDSLGDDFLNYVQDGDEIEIKEDGVVIVRR